MMTAQKIDMISRYANGVYFKNYEQWALHSETFEDFKQSLLCLALEFPEDSPALLLKKYKFSKMCAPEEIPLKIGNMTMFSTLTENIEDDEQLIEFIGGAYNPFELPVYNNVIYIVAKRLYDNEKFYNLFLDYMSGQSIGGGRQRDCREKLFRHRFEIIKILLFYGVIGQKYYYYLLGVAKEMQKPCAVKKDLNMCSGAVIWREYYERNKEKIKEKRKKGR